MKKILFELQAFWKYLDKRVLVAGMLLTAIGIFINYRWGLNNAIGRLQPLPEMLAWFGVFLLAFGLPYLLERVYQPYRLRWGPPLLMMIAMAAMIFAWKMCAPLPFAERSSGAWASYWRQVLYWPYKALVISLTLWIVCRVTGGQDQRYGLQVEGFNWKPYMIMLLIMVPLIIAASSQSDFLHVYPKMNHLQVLRNSSTPGVYKLLYEIAYGLDFFTIELFFRGFLILGFIRYAGRSAILPMAMFYCTIHFGKPLGECISSFFGGMILGVLTFYTRTIAGGLMVHLGIAWLMEFFAWLNLFGK